MHTCCIRSWSLLHYKRGAWGCVPNAWILPTMPTSSRTASSPRRSLPGSRRPTTAIQTIHIEGGRPMEETEEDQRMRRRITNEVDGRRLTKETEEDSRRRQMKIHGDRVLFTIKCSNTVIFLSILLIYIGPHLMIAGFCPWVTVKALYWSGMSYLWRQGLQYGPVL